MVDLDPCLSKKPLEDSACHPYNTRGSMSEVHSLSSFQSESCDDNGEPRPPRSRPGSFHSVALIRALSLC